jgi:hypothetical protein
MICVKTGMWSECRLAQRHVGPDNLILTGIQSAQDLERLVPKACAGIISVGLCGGLRPLAPRVAQVLVCRELALPGGRLVAADHNWAARLLLATRATQARWYSSGEFNQANTQGERDQLFIDTGAWAIDDETYHVALFAQARGIPWAGLRSVSDAYDDDVSIASKMLRADGTPDPWEVFKGVVTNPIALMTIYANYQKSMVTLETALRNAGPRCSF